MLTIPIATSTMLVDTGSSAVIIEHNLDVISQSDWMVQREGKTVVKF